jgi:hypothetical protein
MMDDHLHKSGILQEQQQQHTAAEEGGTTRNPQFYDHAWLCASQSIQVQPVADLLWNGTVEQVTSHIWVTRVGSSSVQLGNALLTTTSNRKRGDTTSPTVLALAQRIFVRKEWNGSSAPFSESEAHRLRHDCGPTTIDHVDVKQYNDKLPLLPSRRNVQESILRWNHVFERKEPIWTVPVGVCHVNFGGHADHAFLAETAHHALLQAVHNHKNVVPGDNDNDNYSSLALNYLSEVMLGDTLHCYQLSSTVHPNDNDIIVVTRTPSNKNKSEDTSTPVPVLLAQQGGKNI